MGTKSRGLLLTGPHSIGISCGTCKFPAGSEWFVDQYAMESMEIRVVRDTVSRDELTEFAKQQFGDMTKAVVDVEQGIMAIGGELHSEEEAVLLDQGSAQRHLWGVNLYSDKPLDEWIEFDSMINVRPSGGKL